MLKLIVGLGNPGQQYEKTRHNAGFWFLEGLQRDTGFLWSSDARFQANLAAISIVGNKVHLLRPATFMNQSGLAVGMFARYFKIAVQDILVVHDDLDIAAGDVRFKRSGGHAGHNGLRDIISHLGSGDFCRLRIGIGRPVGRLNVADSVLSPPGELEKEKIKNSFVAVYENLGLLVANNYERFMSRIH